MEEQSGFKEAINGEEACQKTPLVFIDQKKHYEENRKNVCLGSVSRKKILETLSETPVIQNTLES